MRGSTVVPICQHLIRDCLIRDCLIRDCLIRDCRIRDCRIRDCRIRDCRIRDCRIRDCRIRDWCRTPDLEHALVIEIATMACAARSTHVSLTKHAATH
jgi:hypothetical protein